MIISDDLEPTPAMLRVLAKMAGGWELGKSVTFRSSSHWLQKGGIGRGGESQDVNASTAHGLYDLGLIVWDRGFPTARASLTNAGRKWAEKGV